MARCILNFKDLKTCCSFQISKSKGLLIEDLRQKSLPILDLNTKKRDINYGFLVWVYCLISKLDETYIINKGVISVLAIGRGPKFGRTFGSVLLIILLVSNISWMLAKELTKWVKPPYLVVGGILKSLWCKSSSAKGHWNHQNQVLHS